MAGRKAVDFENLAFAQGNHLMTNKKCDLPQKSYRAAHKVILANFCSALSLSVHAQQHLEALVRCVFVGNRAAC